MIIPKHVTRKLPDLQTEHIFHKACYGEAKCKYSISFIFNFIFGGGQRF